MTMGMMMIMMIIRMSRSLDHILESSESSSLSTSMDINTRSLTRYRQDTITLLYQLIYSMLLYWIHQHQVPHQIQGGHYLSSLPAYICCYTGYTNTRFLTRYRQDNITLLHQLVGSHTICRYRQDNITFLQQLIGSHTIDTSRTISLFFSSL